VEKSSKLLDLEWLLSLPPWNGVNYTPLSFTQELLDKLGNPQNSYRSIHIAGTNGKGTVASLLNHILVKKAYVPKVGLMSSPHIFNINERCLINSCPVSDEELNLALARVKECCDQIGTTPTFFVAITAAIFKIFEEQKVELAIIEVGLGGRFDATNLISAPEISIITSIGLDHQEQLGNSIEKIALNKAGIIKQRTNLILGELDEVAKQTIMLEAKSKGVTPIIAGCNSFYNTLILSPNFIPKFFLNNLKIVLSCAEYLKVSTDNLMEVISDYHWPRRFNIWEKTEEDLASCFIIDGAHNPPAVELFLESLFKFSTFKTRYKKLIFMFAFLERKEWYQSVTIIKRYLKEHSDIEITCAAICMSEEFVSAEGYSDFKGCKIIKTESELKSFINDKFLSGELMGIFGSLKLPTQIEDALLLEGFSKVSFLNH